MADTDIHGPAAAAPNVTDEYARCKVCGVQWQVRGAPDKQGCPFCKASHEAVSVHYEGQR